MSLIFYILCQPSPNLLAVYREFCLARSSSLPATIKPIFFRASDRLSSGYPPNLNMIPEASSYPSQTRYDHAYSHSGHSHSSRHSGFRPLNHEPVSPQWNQPSEYVGLLTSNSTFEIPDILQFPTQERGLVSAHIPNDSHTRYQ